MAIFFSDGFNGSGAFAGHSPELGYGGLAWVSSDMTLDGVGYVGPTNNANRQVYGTATYGVDSRQYGNDSTVTLDFSFKTGPNVSTAQDNYGFRLVVNVNTAPLSLSLGANEDGWQATVLDFYTYSYREDYPSISPNTEYVGSAKITPTSASLTIAGVTVTMPMGSYVDSRIGFSSIELSVGGTCKVGYLVVNDSVISNFGADLSAPAGQVTASGTKISSNGSAALICPAPMLQSGGNKLTGPAGSIYAVGHDSTGENDFTYTAPKPVLVALAGANASIAAPAPKLSIAATVTRWGASALAAPAAIVSGAGTVAMRGDAALRAPPGNLVGFSGAICSIAVAAGTLQAKGTTGQIGGAAITAPLFELTASGEQRNHGYADLLAPAATLGATLQAWLIAPAGVLTAIGTAVVAVTYEAYSINLSHRDPEANDEVTRYTNFPFERIVRYQGSYFGMAADGLYLLEGATDDGEVIAYEVKTCLDDFKKPELKTMASAYVSGRVGPATTVTLFAGETGEESYAYATPRGPGAQNHRQKFGRGVKSRYFALGLAGEDVLEVDSIESEILAMKRRI